jgi:hypothetical protein
MTDGVETAELIIQVEHCWSTDYRIGLSGWAVSKIGRLERLELLCGDASVPVEQWLSRPDIRLRYPEYLADDRCGFVVEIERRATHRLTAKARINGEIAFAAFKADVQEPTKDTSPQRFPFGPSSWRRLTRENFTFSKSALGVSCRAAITAGTFSPTGFTRPPSPVKAG